MHYITISTSKTGEMPGRIKQAVKAKLLEAYGYDYVKQVHTGWMYGLGKQHTVIFVAIENPIVDGLICTRVAAECGLSGLGLFDSEGILPLRLMLVPSKEAADYPVFVAFNETEQEYLETDFEDKSEYIIVHVNGETVWCYIDVEVDALEK